MKGASSQESLALKVKDKWRYTIDYIFEGNILLHGNADFEVTKRGSKDPMGLGRRFIKFPCNTITKVFNSNLFALLEKNKLQFIHWALTCDLPCDFFLGKVPALNEFIDQYRENKMRAFVLNRIYIDPKAVTPLGAVELPQANSLYRAYMQFCLERDYEICSWSKFSSQFLVTLRSLRVEATKTRRKDGQHIKGVTLKEGTPVCPPDKTFADELRGRDPFDTSSRKEETLPSPPLIGKGVQTDGNPVEEAPAAVRRGRGRARKDPNAPKPDSKKATKSPPRKVGRPQGKKQESSETKAVTAVTRKSPDDLLDKKTRSVEE